MNRPRHHHRILVGVIVIVFGLSALADNLFLFNTRQVIQFWPVVFIVIGGVKLANRHSPFSLLFGLPLVATGLLMTLSNIGLVSFQLHDWWPVLLIIAGIGMIAGGPHWRGGSDATAHPSDTGASAANSFDAMAIMSGNKFNISTQDFRLGDATAFMGGMEIDMRHASIQGQAMLDVFAMWGGIVVRVPTDWAVECKGVPILGGIDDKTVPPATPSKRLLIDGFVLMGGVEIKN